MKPLDRLSALSMAHHAEDDDLLRWSYQQGARTRTTCKRHLLLLLYRTEHRNDAVKFAPGEVELLIVRDGLEDKLRRGLLLLYSVNAPGARWVDCARCRVEQAKKYGHLHR